MLLELGLLLPALVLGGVSLLTWVRVPVIIPWRATVIAGEYGHNLAICAGGWAIVVCWLRAEAPGFSAVSLILCGVAMGGFLRPLFSACRVARRLPLQMNEGQGGLSDEPRPFAVAQLWKPRPPKVSVETYEFTAGLKLDFWRATCQDEVTPCVVMIHGGGWDSGDRVEIPVFNDWLAHEGYAVASVDYRLAPEHVWPAQRDDVLSAVQWLKAHASELGIQSQFVLMGRSAGGQIASATAYTACDDSIHGVIALYAPHDMPFAWSVSRPDDALNSENLMRQYMGGPPDTPERQERYYSASGHLNIDPVRPMPTLLMHGLLDTLVWYQHSRRFAASLAEVGHSHLLIEFPWAAHAFEYNLSGPAGQLATHAVRRFLDSVTRIK